jgi:asparagine synthase (glutamine-hydrolysing)
MVIGPTAPALTKRYWRAEFRTGPKLDEQQWIEETRRQLLTTTARHMQADVPTAAFLSGGIDSSIVLAMMARSTSRRIEAFTISHPGHRIDESEAAAEISRHLGCEHVVTPLREEEVIACLPEIAACYDEPFADIAAIPTWFVSRLAATRVKVVLCGEGGDELFCGYKRHRNADVLARYRAFAPLASGVSGVIERLPATPWPKINRWRQYSARFREFAAADDGYQQLFLATQISSAEVRGRLCPSFDERDPRVLEDDYFSSDRGGTHSPLAEFMHGDLTLNLPSQMLTRLDRASMAHSLEARVPFLSHKMVEWALTVPENLKLRHGVGKYILRRAAEPWLPAKILKRPKQGFQIPLASWLRNGPVAQFMEQTIEESGAMSSGYLDPAQSRKLAAEHRAGAADHSRVLYAVLIFALWWERTHVSRQRVEAGAA